MPGSPDPDTPDGVESAIRTVIDEVNATAGGPVAEQQRILADAIDPALADALAACPTATTTLRLEPVYDALRPAPAWSGPGDAPAGTVYLLPALIRIYTGDRITGTDLDTIAVGVQDGRAALAPVCVA